MQLTVFYFVVGDFHITIMRIRNTFLNYQSIEVQTLFHPEHWTQLSKNLHSSLANFI
jgi:hypothetical protein